MEISAKNIGDTWAAGSGIFETLRVEDGKVFALHRHHCRAKETAEKLGFPIPTEEFVAKESYEVIQAEDFALGRLRWHFDKNGEFTISYVAFEQPETAAKLNFHDKRSENYDIRNKEFPYKNLEILNEAKKAGYDDSIILSADGQLTETSMATLLLKIDNNWITPPLSSGILNGVVRALVLEAGLAQVRKVKENEVEKIQSGLLLTSLRNAQNIAEISGQKLDIDSEKCAEIHKLMNEFKGR
jgi:branched-subunit amino acid aminotransferase/4-amino-4-deoxychorismate lyase